MTAKPKSRRKAKPVRHPFLYELISGDGTSKKYKAWAQVEQATAEVALVLTEAHVLKSMTAHGAGNTSSCSVAICSYDHAQAFPHPVEGHIDFNYSRAFVVSEVNEFGLPSRCVAYEHAARSIALLNDTEGGQKKLLARIQKTGPITIVLKPYRKRSEDGRSGEHRKRTGARSLSHTLKGARLRYAIYKLGANADLSLAKDGGA